MAASRVTSRRGGKEKRTGRLPDAPFHIITSNLCYGTTPTIGIWQLTPPPHLRLGFEGGSSCARDWTPASTIASPGGVRWFSWPPGIPPKLQGAGGSSPLALLGRNGLLVRSRCMSA